jgi:hypothetical protein
MSAERWGISAQCSSMVISMVITDQPSSSSIRKAFSFFSGFSNMFVREKQENFQLQAALGRQLLQTMPSSATERV